MADRPQRLLGGQGTAAFGAGRRDEQLREQIMAVYAANFEVYGAYKTWRELNRQGTVVAAAPWSG